MASWKSVKFPYEFRIVAGKIIFINGEFSVAMFEYHRVCNLEACPAKWHIESKAID